MDTLVDILREQLQRAQERERAYEAREQTMQEHIAQLTSMLHEAHQQNQRLLDMPRSMPPTAGPQRPHDNRVTPAYDPTRYRLGSLCVRGHDYAGTGQTLRRIPNGACPQCETEAQRARRQARRQHEPS
jgi:hypothetical protein